MGDVYREGVLARKRFDLGKLMERENVGDDHSVGNAGLKIGGQVINAEMRHLAYHEVKVLLCNDAREILSLKVI